MSEDVAWTRTTPACLAREVLLTGAIRPLIALYGRRSVDGLHHLGGLRPPVIFVANHCSHIDTPLILGALPWSWRRRTGVAAATDYFYERQLLAHTVSLAFGTVPVERNGGNAVTSSLDRLLDENWNLVLFAEGTRSRNGKVGALQSGAAVLASEHGVPIVPVYVSGTHETMPPGRSWMRRARGHRRQRISVSVGPPIAPRPRAERREVMEQVRLFFASRGAATTPNKRLASKRREAIPSGH
ncbi:MAG TPA: lysophospholipid acyltransferase family protein [Thermoleophilaceae bacterium]|jgi:1-acyl-sn-glycerol-3-phosphate acyltransferase|nr:lysophospholipid acyltransferase family protein [Thermoleophilaceae bacterium]